MEAKNCDVNHLEADVLLPPRKRLLAGLKKQSSGGDGNSRICPFSSFPHLPSSSYSSASNEFNTRLNNLLSSHSNPSLSPVEIVEASRSAATVAVKAAEAARAAAEEKAAIAAKAVAAAKSALDLVASISEDAACKERNLRKSKLKKHVPVKLLYKKYQPIENCKTDEELARKLHRAINSSPRILKSSPSNDSKGHKHKKLKLSCESEKTRVSITGTMSERNIPSIFNGHAKIDKFGSDGIIEEVFTPKSSEKTHVYEKGGQSRMDNSEAETSQSKERTWEDMSATGKKRGRVKLKKLPLSICSFRDQATPTPKEDMGIGTSRRNEKDMGSSTTGNIPSFSVESQGDGVMPVEATSTWKCQEFKAPLCVKQNKVMQS